MPWYFWVLGQSNRTTYRNFSPNSPNYVDWNTQIESNLKFCSNFIYYILKYKVCKCTIASWVVVPLLSTDSIHHIEWSLISSVPIHGHRCFCLHTYFILSILGRPIYKIMGWDTQKLALKMKNIKYACHLAMALHSLQNWVINQELSIRSYQTELWKSLYIKSFSQQQVKQSLQPSDYNHNYPRSRGGKWNSSWERLRGQLKLKCLASV